MTPDNFIKGLKFAIEDQGIKEIIQSLKKPAGKSPRMNLVELSNWYSSQKLADKNKIEEVVAESVKTTMFGILCALDNVRKIDDDNGWFELNYVSEKDDQVTCIKSASFGSLHDVYRATI